MLMKTSRLNIELIRLSSNVRKLLLVMAAAWAANSV